MTTTSASSRAVSARNLQRSFHVGRGVVEAVRGVSLDVGRGVIFGLLGPNGAGKTTTLRMLTTLLPVSTGEAFVAGVDVRREPRRVRRHIGYVGQAGGTDASATGRENLVLQGQLHRMPAAEAKRRAEELIDLLELGAFADRLARTYSGGQKRRLEVALGIMHRPEVLFLDEPTTGLDPQNRANLWDQLRALKRNGTTIVVTTHYLEEADTLADELAIIDHGRVITEGSPSELKRSMGGDTIVLTAPPETSLPTELERTLAREPFVNRTQLEGNQLRIFVDDGPEALPVVLERAHTRTIELASVSLLQPTLDDVFLQRTGRSLRDANTAGAKPTREATA